MRKQLGLVMVMAWGCGGGGDDGDGDALRIRADGAALIVGQDGDGGWEQLTVEPDGFARLQVASGFYGVIAFCAGGDAHGTFATSFEDVTLFCISDRNTVEISGTTVPDAEVYTGYASIALADASGAYSLSVDAGVHDVFAVLPGSPSRVLARRGVDASVDVVLDLPIAAEGIDMPTMTPVVTGELADETSVYADMNTGSERDYVSFGSGPTTVSIPPPSVLVATDHPAIGVSSGSAFQPDEPFRYDGCATQLPLGATVPTLALPARFSATVSATELAWHADASVDWETTGVVLRSAGASTSSVQYFATASWHELAVAGQQRLPMPDLESMPGWTAGLTTFAAGAEVRWSTWTYRGVYHGDYVICGAGDSLTW